MKTQIKLRLPTGTVRLSDNKQWTNRFEIKSETSDRVYVVAQNIVKRFFACSCPAWRTRRNCKHLASLSLPAYEAPQEIVELK